MGSPDALWLYLVTASTPPAEALDGLTGVGGSAVTQVSCGSLTAIVELVSLADFGAEPLRQHLEDLSWLEATARAHHRVIDAVARTAPVVPMRLATVYSTGDLLTGMLTDRAPSFLAVLARLQGRVELGVKAIVSHESAPAEPVAAGRPAGGEAGAGAGRAYLNRRRNEREAREQSRQRARMEARDIHAVLSVLAAGSRLHPPQSPELTGRPEAMVLNAAYLLGAADVETFAGEVGQLRHQHPDLRLELTGPWPPYSFAELDDEVA